MNVVQTSTSIALIDDDPDYSSMLDQSLKNIGYDVQVFHHCKQALEQFETELPDIVITDIVMPEINGLQLTQILRDHYPNLPIIAISGGPYMGQKDVYSAGAFGAEHLLIKPFKIEELHNVIVHLISSNIDLK